MERMENDAAPVSPDRAPPLVSATLPTNFDVMLSRCGGDRELLATLIGMFPAESHKLFKSMEEARSASDWLVMQRSAHTLKGICSMFEANEAAASALDLEQAAWAEGPGTQDQVDLLKKNLADALDAVAQLPQPPPI